MVSPQAILSRNLKIRRPVGSSFESGGKEGVA
jgi:hypothetical protein